MFKYLILKWYLIKKNNKSIFGEIDLEIVAKFGEFLWRT